MKRFVPKPDALCEAVVELRGDEPHFGPQERCFRLPGGTYRFVGLSTSQAEALEPRFGPWRCDGDLDADVTVEVRRAPESAFVLRDVAGEVSSLERRFDAERILFAGFDLLAAIDRDDLATRLWTPVDGASSQGSGSPDPRFLDAFENILRALSAYRCLELGGALFHSSGVVTERGVDLFVGPSGAGKTTVARLSLECGYGVLSDDINLVLPAADGAYRAQKLPFAGELGYELPLEPAAGGVVVGIHRLVQASEHAVRVPRGGEALAALLGSTPFVNSDPYALDLLLANLEPLQSTVDELRFRPDADFWRLFDVEPQEVLA